MRAIRQPGEASLALRYLLVMRFILVNLVACGLAVAAWLQGWLVGLNERTTLICSAVVVAVFVYGLVLCGIKIWRTSVALNALNAGSVPARSEAARYVAELSAAGAENRSIHIGMLRMKLGHKIQIVRQIASLLVFLGLIGTVVGFIIALSGVRPEAVSQAESVTTMVATLIQGMSVALYTTLLGAVLNVWLNINHRILATGTVNLMSAIIRVGEARGPV